MSNHQRRQDIRKSNQARQAKKRAKRSERERHDRGYAALKDQARRNNVGTGVQREIERFGLSVLDEVHGPEAVQRLQRLLMGRTP